jgi:hypothetical protein
MPNVAPDTERTLALRKTEWAYIEVSNFELTPGIIPVVIYFTNELCDPTGRLLYARRSLRDCAFFLSEVSSYSPPEIAWAVAGIWPRKFSVHYVKAPHFKGLNVGMAPPPLRYAVQGLRFAAAAQEEQCLWEGN